MLQRGTSDRGHGTFFTEQNPRENTAVTIMEENIDLIFSQLFAAAPPANRYSFIYPHWSTSTGNTFSLRNFRNTEKKKTRTTQLSRHFLPASNQHHSRANGTSSSSRGTRRQIPAQEKHRSGTVPLPDFEATAANEKWLLQTLLALTDRVCVSGTLPFFLALALSPTLWIDTLA